MKYRIDWVKEKETNHRHTAATRYVADGFVIWKGKRRVFSSIYSANEWHLIRVSDGRELHYGKTAKECMGALEYSIRRGMDIYKIDDTCVACGAKFRDDFGNWYLELK